MARTKPLSRYPTSFEQAFRKALDEGTFNLIAPEGRINSYRNELYAYRRAYIEEGTNKAFAAQLPSLKISRIGTLLRIHLKAESSILGSMDTTLEEALDAPDSPAVSNSP